MKYIKLKDLINETFDDTDSLDGQKFMRKISLDDFTKQYIETALWSSTDNLSPNGGEPLDKKYTIDDIESSTLQKMIKDCTDFQTKYSKYFETIDIDDSGAGHKFWLSRNGHGTGFFDIDDYSNEEKKKVGDYLQKASKQYGEYNLYLGDGKYDGLICGYPQN